MKQKYLYHDTFLFAGPLITDEGGYYSQIGVVSWGRGCAHPELPGVYARVTEAESFIQDNIRGSTCLPPQKIGEIPVLIGK